MSCFPDISPDQNFFVILYICARKKIIERDITLLHDKKSHI